MSTVLPSSGGLSPEVRAASVLTGALALVGVALMALGGWMLTQDGDLLFVVWPLIAGGALIAGLYVTGWSVQLTVRLLRTHPDARLQVAVAGGCCVGLGLLGVTVNTLAGLVLVLWGGALLGLMLTEGARRDLGPFARAVRKQRAPWGSRPGTAVWSDEPQVQGPWSPDPRTVPWLPSRKEARPFPPWWQTWETGLRQGVPLWELLVLGAGLLLFLAGNVAILMSIGQGTIFRPRFSAWALLLLPGFASIWYVERRLRARLARGR